MKITLDLPEEQLAKFGITDETPLGMAQILITKAIEEQIPYRFVLECIENIGDRDTGDELWSSGGTYYAGYYYDKILADSNVSDFRGTFLNEDDFLNCFIVKEASPEVAKAMCAEGYTDMFEKFLPKDKEKTVEKGE